MNFKKSIVYIYILQKQLQIPLNRYFYNLNFKIKDLFEKQKKNANDFNHILSIYSIKKKLKLRLEDLNSFRIIFIDGKYHYNNKYFIKSLSKAFYLKESATIIDIYYKRSFLKKRSIAFQTGVYFYIKDGFFVKKLVEILYISTVIFLKRVFIRNLIIIGKSSCVKIFERYKKYYLCNKILYLTSINEIYVHSYSNMNLCKIKDNKFTSLFDQTFIFQNDRSDCNINSFLFDGESIKYCLLIYQYGKEIHSYVNGLSIQQRHIIYNSLIKHVFFEGKSRDLYKGIYDKIDDIFFNDKIIVLKSAKKTNSSQKSINILLNNKIRIITNPQLEIFASNVKCFHGCIVRQLDPLEFFYLRSRGFSKEDTEIKLLVAFTRDFFNSFPHKILKYLVFDNINKKCYHQ